MSRSRGVWVGNDSAVPTGTDDLTNSDTRHAVLGYFRAVPDGTHDGPERVDRSATLQQPGAPDREQKQIPFGNDRKKSKGEHITDHAAKANNRQARKVAANQITDQKRERPNKLMSRRQTRQLFRHFRPRATSFPLFRKASYK